MRREIVGVLVGLTLGCTGTAPADPGTVSGTDGSSPTVGGSGVDASEGTAIGDAGTASSSAMDSTSGDASSSGGPASPSSSSDASSGGEPPGLSPEEQAAIDDNWALRETRAIEAWQLVRARGREPGEGVLIAQPDTGASPHPELQPSSDGHSPLRWDLARDFVDGDDDPQHGFDNPLMLPAHGHGTETSSVIVSPLGCPLAGSSETPCVTGAAPAASVVPLRISDTVVLVSGDTAAEAVDYAVEIGAHVISISMGGVTPMPALETAIENARAAGIIVVAAAGNGTGIIVVAPSTFDGVVCVAGITPDIEPWSTSARGPRVDISGPAVDVRYARVTEQGGALAYGIGLAQGTSDATALTASAAALWLSYHGRDALLERYGAAGIPVVFRSLLTEYGVSVPPRWPESNWGAGVLDMVALLEAPLP